MKIVALTTEDPLYLPAFFDRFCGARSDVLEVVSVDPIYKGHSAFSMAKRYVASFGFGPFLALGRRVARHKLMDKITRPGPGQQHHSIRSAARAHGVPYRHETDVNSPSFLAHLRELGPDLIVSVSCPQIFEKPLIELPSAGCLNIHGSILPHYRGVLPSFWMLAHGREQAGVSIFFVSEKIDAGDLCGRQVYPIESDDTLDSLIVRSKQIACDLLLEVIARIEAGTITREPLDLSKGSYYGWPTREAYAEFRARGRRLW